MKICDIISYGISSKNWANRIDNESINQLQCVKMKKWLILGTYTHQKYSKGAFRSWLAVSINSNKNRSPDMAQLVRDISSISVTCMIAKFTVKHLSVLKVANILLMVVCARPHFSLFLSIIPEVFIGVNAVVMVLSVTKSGSKETILWDNLTWIVPCMDCDIISYMHIDLVWCKQSMPNRGWLGLGYMDFDHIPPS